MDPIAAVVVAAVVVAGVVVAAVVVGGAAAAGVAVVAVTSILDLFVSYVLTKVGSKMLTRCTLLSVFKCRFVAVVGILHIAKFLSPVPEHVVADAHTQPCSQPQI